MMLRLGELTSSPTAVVRDGGADVGRDDEEVGTGIVDGEMADGDEMTTGFDETEGILVDSEMDDAEVGTESGTDDEVTNELDGKVADGKMDDDKMAAGLDETDDSVALGETKEIEVGRAIDEEFALEEVGVGRTIDEEFAPKEVEVGRAIDEEFAPEEVEVGRAIDEEFAPEPAGERVQVFTCRTASFPWLSVIGVRTMTQVWLTGPEGLE